MGKPINITLLEKEHQLLYTKCNSLCTEISRQLQLLIDKESISLAVPIQSRAKNFSSISEKIKQGRFNVKKSITELQDLAGLRIITLFKRDAAKVAELIESQLDILNRYNTEEKLDDSEFGYSSIHVIGKVKQSWLDIPSFSDFKDLKLEIQIRTLSQHSWAEASNVFQYKKEGNVPKPLKRSISRISALLETVDLEFERLLTEREGYKNEMKVGTTDSEDELLNVDSLRQILDTKLPEKNRDPDDDYSALLDNLMVLGFSTVGKLNEIISKHLENILKLDSEISLSIKNKHEAGETLLGHLAYHVSPQSIPKVLSGSYFSHTGIIRNMLNEELGERWYDVYNRKLEQQEQK